MNYLAHLYLSGDNRQVQLGNFIADSIKGKQYLQYADDIRRGILMHRAIDTYTDTHPVFRQGASRLFGEFRHYHLVLMDMFYDHFLAKHWEKYTTLPLHIFAQDFYGFLISKKAELPLRTQNQLPYLIRDNWLLKYQTTRGLEFILRQMSHRIKNKYALEKGIKSLIKFYPDYESEFFVFFDDIRQFVQENPEGRW